SRASPRRPGKCDTLGRLAACWRPPNSPPSNEKSLGRAAAEAPSSRFRASEALVSGQSERATVMVNKCLNGPWVLYHLQQIRAPRVASVTDAGGALARAIRRGFVARPICFLA